MPFVVKTNKGYIKRTSHFGMFHGKIVLTQDVADAFRFTRKHDAETRGWVTSCRTKAADNRGKWYSGKGLDHDKFDGPLTYAVEEV